MPILSHGGDQVASRLPPSLERAFGVTCESGLEPAIDAISTALPVLMEKDCAAFLNEINRLRPPPPKAATETKAAKPPKPAPDRGEPTSE